MGDFYQECYQEYHSRTFPVDPSSFLNPLCRCLPSGALILDAGCGSGRDLLWLRKRGFRVIGFDRSPQLAALAKKNTGAPVIVGDFEAFDFSRFHVDALLLVGALVHVPHERFPALFRNLIRSLRTDGHVLLTVKEGNGTGIDRQGRQFFYWQDEQLQAHFQREGLARLEFFKQASLVDPNDIWLTYLLRKNPSPGRDRTSHA